ncbi:unnamed protein product, partial [Prorocentrum cordatum]
MTMMLPLGFLLGAQLLDVEELEKLISLSEKAGDQVAVEKYKQQLADHEQSQAPTPVQQRASTAHSRVVALEDRLQQKTDKLEELLGMVSRQKARVIEVQQELDKADKYYCDIVAELAGGIVQPKAPTTAKICRSRLVNSEIKPEELFDTAAFFDVHGYEATDDDKAEIGRCMGTMQEALQKCAKELLSGALASVENIKKEHADHISRMGKKRKT